MKNIIEHLKDIDYKVRKEAVLSLASKKSEEGISLLVEALGDENPIVSQTAVQVLKEFGDLVIPHMIEALKHSSWNVRRNASGVLVELGNSFLGTLLDLAKTNDDDIQFWICEVISRFGAKAVPTLSEVLEKEDLRKKICAISALGKTGVPDAVQPLIHCLSDPNWTIRKTAAGALINLGPLAVPTVTHLLTCKTPDLEFWAIQILSEVGGENARKCLVRKLLEENLPLDQKQVIINGLKTFESPEVIPPLIQMLGDDDWIVRKQAAEALWELFDLAQDELSKALKSKNQHIRYWSCRVIGDSQSSLHLSALLDLMRNDPTWSVRAAAAQALGEIGDDSVALDLVDALRDNSEYVRKNAMIALTKLGEIKEAKQKISEEWIQDYTRKVFSDLKSRRTKNIEARLNQMIRNVKDFPKPGIIFKDISPLLASKNGLNDITRLFESFLKNKDVDIICGIESRGFIFGSCLAQALRCGFVPIRKKGKLPGPTIDESYDLEYGSAQIEVQPEHLQGKNIVILDDVLATGGTAKAACDLVCKAGGKITAVLFLMEIDFLKGREKLGTLSIHSILHS